MHSCATERGFTCDKWDKGPLAQHDVGNVLPPQKRNLCPTQRHPTMWYRAASTHSYGLHEDFSYLFRKYWASLWPTNT